MERKILGKTKKLFTYLLYYLFSQYFFFTYIHKSITQTHPKGRLIMDLLILLCLDHRFIQEFKDTQSAYHKLIGPVVV